MAIATLAEGYAGDLAWSGFARAYGAVDEGIESVVAAIMGEHSATWLTSPIPALDGRRPHDVLANEPNGTVIVRSLTMRMP